MRGRWWVVGEGPSTADTGRLTALAELIPTTHQSCRATTLISVDGSVGKGNTAFASLVRGVPKLTVEGFRYYLLRGRSLGQQKRSTGWKLTRGGQTIEPGTWQHTSTVHAHISAAVLARSAAGGDLAADHG